MITSGLRSRLGGAPRHPDQRNKGQGSLEETSASTEAEFRDDVLTVLKRRWGVVAITAGTSAALLGERHPALPDAPAYWFVLVLVGPVLCTLDVALLRLPDAIVLPAAPVALLLIVASAPAQNPAVPARAVAAGVLSGVVLAGLAILSPGGLGWGDVKVSAGLLGPLLGCIGWWALAEAALLGFASAAIVGVLTPLRRREIRGLPLAPFLFGGTLAAVLVNPLR